VTAVLEDGVLMEGGFIVNSDEKDAAGHRCFRTGAVRDVVTDKGRFDLLPARAVRELAKHFQQGARKYEDRNWEKGMPLGASLLDSMLRHAFQILEGDHAERHDRAMAWNAMCFLETVERIKAGILPRELDDIGWLDKGFVDEVR
jgi:hypothetical protein